MPSRVLEVAKKVQSYLQGAQQPIVMDNALKQSFGDT
jgi:hypothetical protein